MVNQPKYIQLIFLSFVTWLCLLSCKKIVSIPQPVNSITTSQVFETNVQATAAMAGVYTRMINSGSLSFSNGYATLLGGLSADELYYYGTTADAHLLSFGKNQLLFNNSYTPSIWTSAYKTIYGANAVIEGIAASAFSTLTDSVRRELTAQAKLVRAFAYFYLTNFFGDVPLVMTVDFNKTQFMKRTPVSEVYAQIIQDLKDAQAQLPADYSTSGATSNGRVIPNKWTATALLARVYLYTGDFANAATEATAVINTTSLYSLETNPNNVFLNNSKEAIWQLKQGLSEGPVVKNATREGYAILPNPLKTGMSRYCVTTSLLNAFEPGDLRRKAWIDSTNNTPANSTPQGFTRFPYKYKLGEQNAVTGAAPSEYYTVFRLAEMYLVRAEAAAHGANGGTAAAIADLNTIRARATLPALSSSLTANQVIAAVAKERQVELFAEWGHRWFDLKRTGRAHDVLSSIPDKQPWAGDYQLLYPIPVSEMNINPNLDPNPGY